MSIEELTKTQLVLLVLFVSFITSIATGVVTVGLLGGTPLPVTVTQTVNRVVEHTIEKVVPGQTLVREVPTVISDEDLLMKTISSSFPAIVEITRDGETLSAAGLGFLVSTEGFIVTPADSVTDRTASYSVSVAGKPERPLEVVAVNQAGNYALLKIADTEVKEKFPHITLDEKVISLGQSVVAQGGDADGTIALGVVTGIHGSKGALAPSVSFAEDKPQAGSPVLTYRGGVVGMWTGEGKIVYTDDLRKAITLIGSTKDQ